MVPEEDVESDGSQIVERQPYQYQPQFSIPFPYRHVKEGKNIEDEKYEAYPKIDVKSLVN